MFIDLIRGVGTCYCQSALRDWTFVSTLFSARSANIMHRGIRNQIEDLDWDLGISISKAAHGVYVGYELMELGNLTPSVSPHGPLKCDISGP